ncbi:MAG TPA: hypothetical protein VHT27_08710 [Solirubrobacteraceae bacterium]|jgi:hypothetical protein|nr:hypothetical protein [Solirubrobacteraceae bacterium]
MRNAGRVALAVACLLLGAPASAPASFGVTEPNWEAGTCEARECTYASIKSNPAEAFTQAAGHPSWGITSFELNHNGEGVPEGQLKRIRVDVPEGLASNPQALPTCSKAQFEASAASCPPSSVVGETELNAVAEPLSPLPKVPLEKQKGTVYNLQLEPGLPLLFGIAIEPAGFLVAPVHLLLKGHVSFAHEPVLAARGVPSGDYHEWFEIDEVPTETEVKVGLIGVKAKLSTLKSKLLFKGRAGIGNFITLPSQCSATTTSYLEVESYEHQVSTTATHTPVGVEHCERVPFTTPPLVPTASFVPETSAQDAPDGASATVTVPQQAEGINTADIKDASVLLPEGVTLNPSAARSLATCSPEQIGIHTTNTVSCPPASKIGTVAIETDLPPHSLKGNVYLAAPSGTPLTGLPSPFYIYIDAESEYGVSVRLEGQVEPDPTTGRLRVTFLGNPQLPFSQLTLTTNGGGQAPLANPLACGTSQTGFTFTPWTGLAAFSGTSPFVTDAGKGAACPSPLPFVLSQTTANAPTTAGADTNYTFDLHRNQGEQYVSNISTVLPAGLLGAIPSVALCEEPQAAQGSCAASSQIGTATVLAGSGEPSSFSGPVYLTGPTSGAPYGLSIPIEAASGPFDLGRVTTRAAINVDEHTARVIVTASPPPIVRGVPLRLRDIAVAVNRGSFLFNPTFCGKLATESTVGGSLGATARLSSALPVAGCGSLPFKPSFAAATSAKTSRAAGASLTVTITQGAHQANMQSVVASLPVQLPSRLTTLQKACPEATYAANPRSCPEASLVGTALVHTPVLPKPLSGPAYLVSHGGAAFPDLDLLLEGNGVRVILVGNTNIKNGITTSTFASIPDVPVSSTTLTLPTGPHSALAAYGSFCGRALVMPTTITGQNGSVLKQSTHVSVSGCGVRIIRHRVKKHTLLLTIQTFGAGRVTIAAKGLRTVHRRIAKAGRLTFHIPLTHRGLASLSLHRSHGLKVKVRVSFAPKVTAEGRSAASATVRFRH